MMTPEELGKGPVDETMRQRVRAIAQETYRRRLEQTHPGHPIDAPTVMMAIEIALSGWTPPEPEPADPDVLAFREWGAADSEADGWTGGATLHRQGHFDLSERAAAYLAGARMAREQERARSKTLGEGVRPLILRLLELAAINDFDETVADGGITSGMVCRKEITLIAEVLILLFSENDKAER